MSKLDDHRRALRGLADWEPYLRANSGLPGPRGNLELAHAVAQEGRAEQFLRWSSLGPGVAPENTRECYLAFCGVLGLGALLARGERDRATLLTLLRTRACDERWRIREAVAAGLQLWGDADLPALLAEMEWWAKGDYLEQRAGAAALCEPRLLKDRDAALVTLRLLDCITDGIARAPYGDRKSDPFRTLRQALAYCWSVAVAAHPEAGVPAFERWLLHPDLDVRWIMRENLGKKRMAQFLSGAMNIQPPRS